MSHASTIPLPRALHLAPTTAGRRSAAAATAPFPLVEAKTPPLRILLLAPQPFFIHRGTPIAVRSVVEVLSEAGYEIDVLAYHLGADLDIPHCRILRIAHLPGIDAVPPGLSMRKLICDAALAFKAATLVMKRRYDVIHAVEESALIAMFLSALTRLPYVYDMDSSLVEQIGDRYRLPRWMHRLLSNVEAHAVRRAMGTITCCQALADLSRQYAPTNPVVVLEDVSLLPPDMLQQDIATDPQRPVVMYVGNLAPYQGIDLLLDAMVEACRELPPLRLVVVGGPSDQMQHYRRRAAEMGLAQNTRFLGPRPIEALGALLSRATIVVSPRIHGHNTPMKVYTYLDSGRPLLATRLPTHTQVLDDTIACLVEPTPDAMAHGMLRLLRDPAYRETLAVAARQRVQSCYSPAAYRDKLCTFYQSITLRVRRRARRQRVSLRRQRNSQTPVH